MVYYLDLNFNICNITSANHIKHHIADESLTEHQISKGAAFLDHKE